MFGWLGEEAFKFEKYNLTYNSHYWSVDPLQFKFDKGLSSMFEITSISYLPDGRPFIASMESQKYPIYTT